MGFSTIGRTDATLPPTRCREEYFSNLPSTDVWQQIVSASGEGMLHGVIVNESGGNVDIRITIDGAVSPAITSGAVPPADLGSYWGLPIKFSSQLIVEARSSIAGRDVLVRYGTV